MAQDDYIYQSIPIPQIPPFGGNALNNALSTSPGSSSADSNISTAAYALAPSPFGDAVGGGGTPIPPPVLYVTNVTWDSGVGQLVVTFSDATTSNIPFSDCPP